MPPKPKDPAERFWPKVDRSAGPDGCWPWTAATKEHGYGAFRVGGRAGRTVKAHRFAYQLATGPIPDGLVIRHECDNPPCCNPAHLVPGTQGQNVDDMHSRRRRAYRARVSRADVERARSACASGSTQAEVARRLGVTPSYVSLLVAGKRGQGLRPNEKGAS